MTTKDRAMLFWGDAFYGDERVALMSLEQQGAFLRLLWLGWVNDGLPEDLRQLARLAGAAPARFARAIWPALEACWPVVDGRRRNPRQERERAARAAARAAADAGGSSVSDRMRALAQRRWNAAPHARAHAATHADADARPHADADARPHADADAAPQFLQVRNVSRLDVHLASFPWLLESMRDDARERNPNMRLTVREFHSGCV